jgi:lysophospholipase L1-like esterase
MTAYTIEDAQTAISDLGITYEVILFHVLTNDLKSAKSTVVVQHMCELVEKTHIKFPDTKIIISLATNRSDKKLYNDRVNAVNAGIIENLDEATYVHLLNNSNLIDNGALIQNLFQYDGVHLSPKGNRSPSTQF